ncbi:MAG: class I tRNA ligase family protein, partial [Planctomycetales bacterium]
VDREIPIIADGQLAKMEMGTGAVKVTPAHDPNDYACGLRNKLEMINILNPEGTLNQNAGKYAGMEIQQARKQVVADMEQRGFFQEVEQRKIDLAHSDRSKTPIQPYLSDQWFVKMDELAENALEAVRDGRVKFYPQRYEKTYLDWLGEKRDWCISRQLWWGHRIPVWSQGFSDEQTFTECAQLLKNDKLVMSGEIAYQADKNMELEAAARVGGELYQRAKVNLPFGTIHVCPNSENSQIISQLEADGYIQDDDVLDTWFSSALWPHATLGWPSTDHNPPLHGEPDETGDGKNAVLDFFYPGSVLVTSRDIITLWVARMVLTGLYNLDDIPFPHVCVHPKILDGFGQTMSKSKGNGVDPLDLIDKYGTDAVRFTIASFAGETQDLRLPMQYECPHCGTPVPQALDNGGPMVKPETLKAPLRGSKDKLRMPCPNCKKESQFSTPQYEPDAGEPVARMVSERFEYGRNFSNKLWNASRFTMMNLDGFTSAPVDDQDLAVEDRWILSRLATVTKQVTDWLNEYHFDYSAKALYDFAWNEFCSFYVEMVKGRLQAEPTAETRMVAQRVLAHTLDTLLRLLHPMMPFLTEEIWQLLGQIAPQRGLTPEPPSESIMIAAWPEADVARQDSEIEARFARFQDVLGSVREIRSSQNIPPKTKIEFSVLCDAATATLLEPMKPYFESMAAATATELGPAAAAAPISSTASLP